MRRLQHHLRTPRAGRWLALAALLTAPAADAAEVVFDGSYRARARWFDTLSLDRDLPLSEGSVSYVQHRVWLRPRFLLSDQVGAYVEVLGFNNVPWGVRAGATDNPTALGTGFEDILTAPVFATQPGDHLFDLTLWRAWGDVNTQIGRFTFGRMPLHWGAGIWQNDGLTTSPHLADYGDTVDRVQWEYLIQDQIFLQAAFDIHDSGFINLPDDTHSYNLVLAYRSESVVAGINSRVRRTPINNFNLATIDLAVDATFGRLHVLAEGIGQFGGGDLPGIAEVSITTFGGVLDASLDLSPWRLQLQGGFASGDRDPRDARIRTFTFDRDYNVGLILFNQPMPTLGTAVVTEATGSRTFEFAQTGNAVSNAMYIRPTLARQIVPGLEANLALLAARAARVPDFLVERGPNYGLEFDLGARYTGIDHVDLLGMFAVFLPGNFYGAEQVVGLETAQFDGPVFGAQLSGRIHF